MSVSASAKDAIEYAQWLLEAQREVDALCPSTPPIAPRGPSPLELEQTRLKREAYTALQAARGRAEDGRPVADPLLFNPDRVAAVGPLADDLE